MLLKMIPASALIARQPTALAYLSTPEMDVQNEPNCTYNINSDRYVLENIQTSEVKEAFENSEDFELLRYSVDRVATYTADYVVRANYRGFQGENVTVKWTCNMVMTSVMVNSISYGKYVEINIRPITWLGSGNYTSPSKNNLNLMIKRLLKLIFIFGFVLLYSSGCSSPDKADGYSWTGNKVLVIPPADPNVPYDKVVEITDPNLAVKADIDFSTGYQQDVLVEVYNKQTGKVISSENIAFRIQTGIYPVIDIQFPDPAIFEAKTFILEEYIHVHGKYADNQNQYDLFDIPQLDLFSGKPGYVLYDANTQQPFILGEWTPGDYHLILVASNAYGNTVASSDIRFTLT